ncbi:putative benzoate 4-monooxygenase cytochrome P450 [Amylocarpus encephaloides]|uniref:Benzoate 4-monooxygenase cytochrome P450 n=1 Tax=Amylocarpus encephaloides TaxID=45428 RepID=A0A9P8C9W4_9HELO|nr:putative benzoate 4-monooxygenase cytochrome P450 [Amylocarpus encephaloides]
MNALSIRNILTAKNLLLGLGVVISTLVAVHVFRTWWRLRHIPGPFLASITNLPRVFWVKTKHAQLIHQDVHRKYGEIVRTGPNMVMFENPKAIPIVHVMRRGTIKAPFYDIFKSWTPDGGRVTVFNATNEETLKKIKSPVAPLFSATNAVAFEGLVDEVLECFERNVNKRFLDNGGPIFDLAKWAQYYAFDVMGTLTFSKRYSFLDDGEDVGGMLGAIYTYMESAAPLTQIPWADRLLFKNWIAHAIRRVPSLKILTFVSNTIKEREAQVAEGKERREKPDFLRKYMEVAGKHPELPPSIVSNWTFTNVIAGSDSVGSTITTIMFHLLQNTSTLQKLHTELSSANLTLPYAKLNETQTLPYLDACMWEALRLHPAFALLFERVVPEGGITVLGHYLPAGTWVGGNPYVVNRHKETFGADSEFWRPERWLEGDERHNYTLQQSTLTFGAGRRICIGRHIGILEVKKMISFLILNYDIHMIDPKPLETQNWWLFRQEGFYVRIEKRANP